MLGIQLQVGERKHAIRDRRFARGRKHEDMHAIYLAGSVSYTYLCDVGFKNCKSKSELGHQKYEKYALQFACLMQPGSNGCEIYKNVRMMHAVVFADRAPEAKNAQVMGENENSKGLKKRKNSDRNGQKSDKTEPNGQKGPFSRPFRGQKSDVFDRKT